MAKGTQQTLALVVGIVLTLVGVIGFYSGESLLGFGLNAIHNIVHLVTGVLGLVVGFSETVANSVFYNKWVGVIYVLVAILGFIQPDLMASLLNVNTADNILHLVLGIVLAGVGFGIKE